MSLTKLLTPAGYAYVDVSDVVSVSAPFTPKAKPGQVASVMRSVMTRGGGAKTYVLDVRENWAILLGEDEAKLLEALEPSQGQPGKKSRKGKR